MSVTHDGGKTFKNVGEDFKHVDNHAMWINPTNNKHWLVGCDGGIYETLMQLKIGILKRTYLLRSSIKLQLTMQSHFITFMEEPKIILVLADHRELIILMVYPIKIGL